eukprot:scaffold207066_cov17-Tisochrysis_lutea.AAC.2
MTSDDLSWGARMLPGSICFAGFLNPGIVAMQHLLCRKYKLYCTCQCQHSWLLYQENAQHSQYGLGGITEKVSKPPSMPDISITGLHVHRIASPLMVSGMDDVKAMQLV